MAPTPRPGAFPYAIRPTLPPTSLGGGRTCDSEREEQVPGSPPALGFVLLALIPRRPIVWPARFPVDTDRRWIIAGACVVLVVGVARSLVVRSEMRGFAAQQASIGQLNRGRTLLVGLGAKVVPDDRMVSVGLGFLSASEMRLLLADYGNPFPITLAAADRRLVDMDLVRSDAGGARRCSEAHPSVIRCR